MPNKLYLYPLLLLALASVSTAARASGSGGSGGGDHPGFIEINYTRGGCERGPTTYIKENVRQDDRPLYQDVLYVCVRGNYYRNGVVPNYQRCQNGAERDVLETREVGDHTVNVLVPYVCVRGRWVRDPR